MSIEFLTRSATLKDCRKVAELIEIAGEGIPSYMWSLAAKEGQQPIEVGIERAARVDINFSYRNATLVEVKGEVAAMLLAYKLPHVDETFSIDGFPDLVRPMVELEMLVPNTFYINGLATFIQYRNRGLGSHLLELADHQASSVGCSELSIQVFEQNTEAVRLYNKHGYQVIDSRPVVPHACYPHDGNIVLMTRPVSNK